MCVSLTNAYEWKSNDEFRQDEANIIRKGKWLATNAQHDSWSDSLKYVLQWGEGVPYLTIGLFNGVSKNYDNILKQMLVQTDSLPYRGPCSSVMLAGAIVFHLENKNSVKLEGAIFCIELMTAYYQDLKKSHPNVSDKLIEELVQLRKKGKLRGYLKNK